MFVIKQKVFRKEAEASLTVEAALIIPLMFLVTFLLIRSTVYCYEAVKKQAGILYDAVVKEGEMVVSLGDVIRISDTAFEIFDSKQGA